MHLFGHRPYWAERFGIAEFLPTTRAEMDAPELLIRLGRSAEARAAYEAARAAGLNGAQERRLRARLNESSGLLDATSAGAPPPRPSRSQRRS